MPEFGQLTQCEGDDQPKANRYSPTNQHGNICVYVQGDVCGKGDNDTRGDDQILTHVIEDVSSAALESIRTVLQNVPLSGRTEHRLANDPQPC